MSPKKSPPAHVRFLARENPRAASAEAANDAVAIDVVRRRGRYASDSMLARRQRMLDAAKQMIAECGSESFTVRELSQRAKVSVTTIYATYGDKEGLLAAAIADYYDQLPLTRAYPAETLDEVLAATEAACAAALGNKPYARQYVELFFSSTVDPRVYAAIRGTASASAGQWLEMVRRRGDILSGLSIEDVVTMLANHRLTVLHDWVQQRISDEAYRLYAQRAFLIFARSITCGGTLFEVEAELRRLLDRTPAPAPRGRRSRGP